MTSREFNQDLARAKREAVDAPVVVTDRGKPTHVLMSYEEFARLRGDQTEQDRFRGRKTSQILAMPGGEDLELELPERTVYERPLDLD